MFYDAPCGLPAVKLEPYQEVLLRAAELIEQRGWCQHSLRDFEGRLCIEGAVREAMGHYAATAGHYSTRPMEELVQYLGEGHPFVWNDQPNRTKEQVLAALRGAASV